MNYNETLNWLFNSLPAYHRIGPAAYKADLGNTHQMMENLDHPEQAFRSVHVAGTNGKGSVSHMLAAYLQQQGLKVGLYTSPHLVDFRERIRIDGGKISQEEVTEFVETHKPFFEQHQLSFFEMTVGMAFDCFRRHRVDIAVVEVGMGGRLDSTNVITPLLSIITNIGLEHTQFLGDTLPKIASEKAGIIKAGVPVVIGESHPETEPVFLAKAKECGADIVFADKHYRVEQKHSGAGDSGLQGTVWKDGEIYIDDFYTPLGGIYQLKNVATLVAAIDLLSTRCQSLTGSGNSDGSSAATRPSLHLPHDIHLHGRWEKVGDNPLTFAETAHNPDGVRVLLDKLATMQYSHLHLIYGCVNDKDYGHILQMLPADATYYYTRPSVERGLNEHVLAQRAGEVGRSGQAFGNVNEALAAARSAAQKEDLVVVTGSIFLIADLSQISNH